MTICIAAVCEDGRSILAMSDRMYVTAGPEGELQYEPSQTKGIALHDRIAILFAGDPSIHDQVWVEVEAEKLKIGVESPELTVKWFADSYAKHYQLLRTRCIERDILAPYALTTEEFVSKHHGMNSLLVDSMIQQISSYPHFDIEVLIFGLDESRGKGDPIGLIYRVTYGQVHAENTTGFVAIGCGALQAESELQLAGYTRSVPYSQAMFLIYCAKKRAELVPGVGRETDMYSMRFDKQRGYIHHGNILEEIYEKFNAKRTTAIEDAEGEVNALIKNNPWF